jgi:hypothetical protein
LVEGATGARITRPGVAVAGAIAGVVVTTDNGGRHRRPAGSAIGNGIATTLTNSASSAGSGWESSTDIFPSIFSLLLRFSCSYFSVSVRVKKMIELRTTAGEPERAKMTVVLIFLLSSLKGGFTLKLRIWFEFQQKVV